MTDDLVLVSGADHAFFGLLLGLLDSLAADAVTRHLPLGVLDVGLLPVEREALSARGVEVVAPGWDVSFPGSEGHPRSFRANVARPFLPEHFPGFGCYAWLDADTWVQRPEAIGLLREAARGGRLAIAPETGPGYDRRSQGRRLRRFLFRTYRESLGLSGALGLAARTPLNVGVFALEAGAPHWKAWRETLGSVLRRKATFYAEQVALNAAVRRNRLAVSLLPPSLNWICGHGRPFSDEETRALLDPLPPHAPLHVVHLTSWTKSRPHDLATPLGGTVTRWLTRDGAPADEATGDRKP